MPVQLQYPGVYIEEIPSGVRTITGVATSITAFIGRARRGPKDKATTITSFADFERRFGGLSANYPMSYAVRDFFLNGGAQAIIVRLYEPVKDGDTTKAATSLVQVGEFTLAAAYEGSWGTKLRATLDKKVPAEVAASMDLPADQLFNLTVTDTGLGGSTEFFRNLSVAESARRIDRVLNDKSRLVRWKKPSLDDPNRLPSITEGSDEVGKAEAGVAAADQELAAAKKDQVAAETKTPPSQAEIDAAKQKVSAAQTKLDGAKQTLKSKVDAADAVDSAALTANSFFPENGLAQKKGLYALEQADLFNLLCIPPDKRGGDTPKDVYQQALPYCFARRAMLLVDAPANWDTDPDLFSTPADKLQADLGLSGVEARNAALYFPRVRQADPLRDGQIGAFVASGIVAGVMARTDTQRGVWKAPAGLDASLTGTQGLEANLTDQENGILNPLGINCLRSFPVAGRVAWGARTLRGADQLADEYKYIPVRRLALYIEESLYRGTQWVVFEPNDEPLWAQIRLNVGAFMHNLFRQGAFQGRTPRDAYFVKCDKETTTQNDINLGIVNIVVGFAPLKPAEFVIIKIQQMAGQIET